MIVRRTTSLPLFGLAPDEVYRAVNVAIDAVSSYLAISPLPAQAQAVSFCCTFCGVAPPGRYPASRPVELGLSSRLMRMIRSRVRPTHSKYVRFILNRRPTP
jgi:hypothetical protein